MEADAIHITDYMRILQGNVPWIFLIECVLRIFFLYALIVLSIRMMGKRMISTVSRSELAALASIAGATGVPMQGPDQGLLPTLVAALVVVGVQRTVAYWSVHNKEFEVILHGTLYEMVVDGRLILANMSKSVLTKERLFSQLRTHKITNLGAVQRLYMEANGSFTLLQFPKAHPGLSLAPEFDQEYIEQQPKAPGRLACIGCGATKKASSTEDCHACGCGVWVPAVL